MSSEFVSLAHKKYYLFAAGFDDWRVGLLAHCSIFIFFTKGNGSKLMHQHEDSAQLSKEQR